ncbi:MAG: T9SS type A sorting domain-containing protein [Flavobacteriaceae bacterium]
MNQFTKLSTASNRIKDFYAFGLLLMTLMCFSSGQAQTLFSQDFSSSTSLSSYINSSAPDAGQFNAITTAGTSTATITSGALRFTRGNSTTSFTRSTNFSTTPTALVYEFDLTVSGTPGGNTPTTARWQIGSGYNSATNGVEADASTYAQMAIDFRGSTSFRFNDVSNAVTSSNFTVGTTYAITWVMNNSGGTLSYLAPDGNTETIANDRVDFWVGTTRVYNDVVVETTGGTLSDMKFAYVGSTGSITLDDISVKAMATPQVSAFSGNTICSGATGQLTVTTSAGTGPFTVVYNDGTANRTATNVSSGTAFDVFSNPSTTTNYTLVSIAEASGTMRTSSFTDGAATITVNVPTVSVGSALSAICQGGTSAALGGSVGGTATGGTWSDGGVGGTFNPNATTLNATWTPPANYSGSATLTLTTSGGSCGTTSAAKTQVVNAPPTATAGGSQTICFGSTATVSGASSSNGTISWTENGAGSITSGGTGLTPVYTPAAGDVGNTVTLTMTVTGNSPCGNATATYTVTVNPAATVNAGGDQTVCATNPNVTLAGSVGGSATSGTWSGGAGTFSPSNNTLNAVYTPSAGELAAGGNITLTLTTNDPAGPCNAVSDSMTLTIKLAPTASAGGTQTICPGAAAVVSGASATNGTISWTENGAGSITAGATSLTPTYTSAAGDAGNTVTLTMTVTNSPCSVATATYTIVVSPAAPAAPGNITGSTTVCTGETTTYSIAAVTNATNYTWTVPSGWTISNGQGTTSINVVAGTAGTGNISVVASNSCGSTSPTQSIDINPLSTTNHTGFTSSSTKTSGNITCNSGSLRGYLRFPLSSIPAGATISSATLTLVNNNSTTVSTATNNVRALGNNDPASTAASTLYNACGSGTSYSATTWSNTGSVVLSLNSSATADIQSRISSPGYLAVGLHRGGTADYNFFGFGNGANSPELTVTFVAPRLLTVTANLSSTVNAGGAVSAICQGGTTAALGGSFGGGATSAVWSDGGAGGTFANNSGTTPNTTTYTAAANAPASVTLTLTTAGGSCTAAVASKILTINPNPTVNAGSPLAPICQGGTTANLGGSYGGGATSAVWNDNGAGGTFANNSGTTPGFATYTAALNAPTSVTLTLVTAGGLCGSVSASKTLTINANPTASAGAALSAICQGGTTAALGGSFGGGATSAVWDDNGAGGTFANNSGSTPATATYTAAANAPASVTLTLTTDGGSCGTVAISKTLTVNPIRILDAGLAVSAICQGETTSALGGSFGGSTTSAVWNDGGAGGTFDNNSGSTPELTTYTAAANAPASVTLTLVGSGGLCGPGSVSKILTVNQKVLPSFTQVAPICDGAALSALPTVSNNGISGTWSPAIDNTQTTTYTFTPNSGECALSTTMQIVVNPILTPTFNQVAPICTGSSLSALPTTSLNGVHGTWSPALNNSATTTYTFTPNSGECAVSTTMEIIVNPVLTPTFNSVAAICSGDVLSALPTTSLNGVTGYWTPALNNTATTTYTFITDPGQCVNNIATTLTIVVNTNTTYYADADNDGYGDASVNVQTCLGTPVGYVTNNTDCNPNDGTKWRTGMFYTDADGDGFNNGFPQTSVCYGASTPTGYTVVNIGTDCDDSLANVNPNASEVLGNNIDDNCDGNIDEVYPTSFLNANHCGSVLSHLSNALYAYQLTTYVNTTGIPVQAYRFEVTNGSNVRTYESTTNSFNLLNLPGGATYATTYSVRVSVKIQGFWRAYGSACTVTTPAVPNSTSITQPACGSTLANISNTIYCGQVPGASGYRFRVRNGATVIGTYESHVNRFSLTDMGVHNITFGTDYSIDVLLKFGNTWRPDTEYGTVCSINTPATPGVSKVVNPACGSTVNRLWTSIYAQQVIGAQGYRFVVTSTSPATSRVYTTPNSVFSLMNLPGGAQLGVTYTIRVDVLYNSSYVQGTETCNITVSPAASRQTATAINVYDVKAYPNPFANHFKLELNSSSENQVSVKVYDMLGREVESRVSSVAALADLEIGAQYPSGVYNIIVTQGENVKTLRVIKR